ncbi:conserved hypothetical protein [Frankia sp. AiPs1]|uniref:hypothetical protein n=1 Tax=Frankia sp. AiPa1 TaxID=573492 RepID=UPI00202B305B|nr:hypothetical protein [Frankia sp. AiPa1]MCL9758811.1 hypothetical protein [Frankia sp. AiPa1]
MADKGEPGPHPLELADLVCLTGGDAQRYAERPIPDERDVAIVTLLRKAHSTGGLDQLLDLIRPEVEAETLRAFSVRMASFAVRRDDLEMMRLGLLALAVAALRPANRRDDLAAFAPLWHAANQLGADPALEFTTAGSAVPPAANLLSAWRDRSDGLRDLRAMGFHESADADGFRYAEDWTLLSVDFDREFSDHSMLGRIPLLRRWRALRAGDGPASSCHCRRSDRDEPGI